MTSRPVMKSWLRLACSVQTWMRWPASMSGRRTLMPFGYLRR
nr:MAG TPA: hypothetical protein [Caudoviricetes sp.]